MSPQHARYFRDTKAMILEEETHNKFGYYPRDLKPRSHKHIFAACDGCGIVRKTTKDKYHDLCFPCARRLQQGPNGSFYGKTHSDKAKHKISIAHKGKYCGKAHPNWKGGDLERICLV